MQVHPGYSADSLNKQLLDIVGKHCLMQVVNIPSRLDKTRTSFLQMHYPQDNRVKGMPPIGKADHGIVYVEYDIKAKRMKQAPRKIFLYKRADKVGLRDHMSQFKNSFLSQDHSHISVNDTWVMIKTDFLDVVERFIPSKMTKTKHSLPWIDSTIRRLLNRHQKLYFRARKLTDPALKSHYKSFRAHAQKVVRDAYRKDVSNIFINETEDPDPDSLRKDGKKSFGHLSNPRRKIYLGSPCSEKMEF